MFYNYDREFHRFYYLNTLNVSKGCDFMSDKDFYKKQIIEMVQKINRCDILEYICALVSMIVKREGKDI